MKDLIDAASDLASAVIEADNRGGLLSTDMTIKAYRLASLIVLHQKREAKAEADRARIRELSTQRREENE